MKQTAFSKYLTQFMVNYLVGERGYSRNTISAYRDTVILLLLYMRKVHGIGAEHIDFKDITRDRVVGFLDWLETDRGCSVSTRNARLAALHSFFRFLTYKYPDNIGEWQGILSIKVKKAPAPVIVYLTAEGIKLLLSQPDTSKKKGRRDQVLMSLMFECASRVQEIADLVPSRINFGKPMLLRLDGKGNKSRLVPLCEQIGMLLKQYMQENGLLLDRATDYPLFGNGRGDKLTRMAITAIIKKYSKMARSTDPSLIPNGVSPHSLRHSKAVLLQQNEVNIIAIRDFLGHVSVTTTEIYIRIDNRLKREALEKTSLVPDSSEPTWQNNKGLLTWLESLGK
ncbi:tyrosine-type recombinase/integrase [Algoriphagus sp.]|uniref:tyrosine-type recombinase/integrase n=1 Tax=Algoriphagus sp. TaxID=1872435 RepID=UPI0026206814|nr:tyrosine-type recombinase/integrase [Algoriphagus sp.]